VIEILSKLYIGLRVKYVLFLSDFNETLIFDRFSESTQILNFMNIRPVEAELFHSDKRTGGKRHEVSSRFLQFCERA
jgi:hypothetical protein